MGWCSGTDFFDDAVGVAFAYAAFSNEVEEQEVKLDIVRSLYQSESFRYSDWDCQQESNYFQTYLKQVMIDLGELDVCPTCGGTDYDKNYCTPPECYNEECPDSEYYEGDK